MPTSTPPYWLGLDLGGTKMLAQVYDADWNVVGSKKRKTKVEEGQAAGLERLVSTGMDALAEAGVPTNLLGGVGIGSPGPLNLKTGTIIRTANLGWKDAPLKAVLEKAFGVRAVVANDVDAGAYGEAFRGAGAGARGVLGVFPGTGIGGGFVLEGRILQGGTLSCMEIGHMSAIPDGPRCGCGRLGCLEAVAGRLAISAAASIAVLRGQAPWLAANAGSDPAKIRSNMLASSVANGDDAVKEIIEHACDHLGRVLGDVVNLLAPDVVVLGGGMVEAMPDLMVPRVRRAMRSRVMDSFADTYSVKAASLGDQATALGAAAWARHLLGKN